MVGRITSVAAMHNDNRFDARARFTCDGVGKARFADPGFCRRMAVEESIAAPDRRQAVR